MQYPDSIPVQRLNAPHPEHARNRETWEHVELLKCSGAHLKANADRFLVKRTKEPNDVYQERLSLFVDDGILGSIIGWYVAKLFRKDPAINNVTGEQWDRFLLNVDRKGTGIVQFFAEVFKDCISFRRSYVLIDKPKPEEAPASRADEMAMGLDIPHLVSYCPLDVVNWKADDYGNLEFIIIKRREVEPPNPFEPKEGTEHYWYVFDRTDYAVYRWVKKDGEREDEKAIAMLVDQGPHVMADQNRVPVEIVEVTDELWLANRALLLLCEHLNTNNEFKWALRQANLAMLLVTGQFNANTLTTAEWGFLHMADPGGTITWLEPQGTSFQHTADRIAALREEIYRICYLQAQGRSTEATPAAQSGYSKEMDMAPANDVLNAFGDAICTAMERVIKAVGAVMGIAVEPDVTGMTFESGQEAESLSTLQKANDSGLTAKSKTLEVELDKRTALALIEDSSEDVKAKVRAEIEAAPTREELAMQKEEQQVELQRQSMRGAFPAVA